MFKIIGQFNKISEFKSSLNKKFKQFGFDIYCNKTKFREFYASLHYVYHKRFYILENNDKKFLR